ncbi:MAG: hypothetical protein ACRENP_19490 [Longimicrobiales bacterium]
MRIFRLDPAFSWKRVIGELALIVGGVLIALGVDSAWQAREERQRESAYLEQLLSDARETESRLKVAISGDSSMLTQVEGVLDQAFYRRIPPRDSFALPTGYQQFRPLTGTFIALVQNGDLRLVRNDSIRFRVIAYVALIDATEVMLRHMESLVWNNTQRVLYGITVHSRTAPGGSGTWSQLNVAAALNDPDVISALRVQATASSNRLRNLRRLEEPTADLIRLLRKELGRD